MCKLERFIIYFIGMTKEEFDQLEPNTRKLACLWDDMSIHTFNSIIERHGLDRRQVCLAYTRIKWDKSKYFFSGIIFVISFLLLFWLAVVVFI